MNEKTKILVVDDSAEMRKQLSDIVLSIKNAELVGTAANGMNALDMVAKFNPDIMLLDIIMPQLDGFGVLEYLSENNRLPAVIVVSALTQENFVSRAFGLGAQYYIAKPFSDEAVSARIKDVISILGGAPKASPTPNEEKKNDDERISSVFLSIGIPAHIKGYHFLREAVKMVIANPDSINRITKELYPGIAKTFRTSPSKVERAIRHAIEVAWTRGKIENINELFGFKVYGKNDKPTNGEFIALIADKLIIDHTKIS